jgi:SutA RNAP-binding domain
VKKIITKTEIRSEINQQITDYLEQGGAVHEIKRGISGRENPTGPLKPDSTAFSQPKAERTYVPEVIAALEKRKSENLGSTKKTAKPKAKKPKKRMIYDDFGEPLRWEWVEE